MIRFATSRELHRGVSWLESHIRSWIVYNFRIVAPLFRLGLLKKTLECRMIGRNLPTVLVVRKGRKRKQLQEARETRMTPRDDRNETEIRNISTRVGD